MNLYMAGPMRGHPMQNLPLAQHAAAVLRARGHDIISPWEHEIEDGFDFSNTEACFPRSFIWDIAQVLDDATDGIVLLPGWESSEGATIEARTARSFGKQVWYYDAGDLVSGPSVVGLLGYAQAGKDTAAQAFVELGYERVAFADALRDMLYALNPIVFEDRDGNETRVQALVDAKGWEYAKSYDEVRALLQRLGTEAGRSVLGYDIWVRTAMAKCKPGGKYVFTDVRFPNEADAIEQLGGQLWRILRPGCGPVNNHPSETALDERQERTTIWNDGDVASLHATVKHIIERDGL